MGKGRSKPKYNQIKARALKERLMPDTEIFAPSELEALKQMRKRAMWARDSQLRREQQEFKRVGTCPVCHVMLTTEGRCQLNEEHTISKVAKVL